MLPINTLDDDTTTVQKRKNYLFQWRLFDEQQSFTVYRLA